MTHTDNPCRFKFAPEQLIQPFLHSFVQSGSGFVQKQPLSINALAAFIADYAENPVTKQGVYTCQYTRLSLVIDKNIITASC
jgi:hypothetical protein